MAKKITIKRIYEPASTTDGFRVLVDRVWPRGVSKADAAIDVWLREIAPSTELRKWYNHDRSRWSEFQRRYRAELNDRQDELAELLRRAEGKALTLLFGARDTQHNQAVVLKQVLEKMSGRK